MRLDVKNISGEKTGDIELDDSVFAAEVHEHLLWEVVKWQLAKRRSGTASTKLRGEVHGSHAKPFKQKGTGRARAGSTKSAQHVGGGRIFGPRPRSYDYALPRKARKKALRAALSLRAQENQLIVLDSFPVDGGKTRNVAKALEALGISQPASKVLIVDDRENEALVRGAKNLRSSKWLAPEGLNVYDVLNHATLVITSTMAKQVEEALRP
jgi:large subunit ribosomal protein L4